MAATRFRAGLSRWIWFAALYVASVGTLAVLTYGLRALLKMLG